MTERVPDVRLQHDVMRHVGRHFGKANRIGRWELVELLFGAEACEPESDENIYDRRIRDAVEALRRQGNLICDLGDGRGRYMATTAEEYWEFRRKYGGRAFRIMETIQALDGAAGSRFGEVIAAMRRKGPEVAAEFKTLFQPKLM